MGKNCSLSLSPVYSNTRPLIQTLSQASTPLGSAAAAAPGCGICGGGLFGDKSAGYNCFKGSWMPCKPSLDFKGTALPIKSSDLWFFVKFLDTQRMVIEQPMTKNEIL
uniref:Uncharacterized protein n=1 Tax=Romanomermis culicivorax TaxID=13658 RepID=A0A915LA10_ROMCU